MCLEFEAIAVNESLARVAIAAFVAPLNPTLEELSDIKTAVSEAVTNAIIHGYENWQGYDVEKRSVQIRRPIHPGKVTMKCRLEEGYLFVEIGDKGKGIPDIEKAMEPLYTTRPEQNRSGMGFAFMEAFTDDLEVESTPGEGTTVYMKKKMDSGNWIEEA